MRLKTGQKCAFGFGAFGKDIVYILISSYLLYYYNVVIGMSSVFIGEYSRAVTPQIRQAGYRLSGLAETAYASLLA